MNFKLAAALTAFVIPSALAQSQANLISVTETTIHPANVVVSCAKTNPVPCYEMIVYASECTENVLPSGDTKKSCTYKVFREYTLKPGESLEIPNVPANHKQCTGLGKPATLGDCRLP
ncbi:MAG: hypothetical protein HY255_05145 [Betaproteobacteria bacterium]|nr:hypothetical protein [Betaproteobacteria bacterium]